MRKLLLVILSVFLSGCRHGSNITNEISAIMRHKLEIPQVCMKTFRDMSPSDSINYSNGIKLVFYISQKQCQTCFFSQLVKFENENHRDLKHNGMEVVCIFESNNDNKVSLEDILYDAGLECTIYIDTCKAFLKSNPNIPKDKEIYHSFVIDSANNILMVGSPFYNEKTEYLFKKILNNK